MKYYIFFAAAAICCGCATRSVVAVNDAGPEPRKDAVDAAVRAWLVDRLKDPDSLKRFQLDDDMRIATYPLGAYGLANGWLACFQYYAKNSYGGYEGLQRDGVIVKVHSDGATVVEMPQSVARPTPSC